MGELAMADGMPEGPGDEERAHTPRGPVAFWGALVGVLIVGLLGGVALTTYLLPLGLLPGDPNADLVTVYDERASLEAEVIDDVTTADSSAEDIDLELTNVDTALIYTVREPNLLTCVDYLGFRIEGEMRSLRLTEVYNC